MGVQAHTAHMKQGFRYQINIQMNLQPILSANVFFFFIELYRITLKYYVTINDLR